MGGTKLMNKKVILAKAGSGKTTYITSDSYFESKRIIYVTYTNNNVANIRNSVAVNQNLSSDNILALTYHSFLIKNFFQPFSRHFQTELASTKSFTNAINWEKESTIKRLKKFTRQDNVKYWCDSKQSVYGNRLSTMILLKTFDSQFKKSINRLSKFCDILIFDEFQDFTSVDARFLKKIIDNFPNEVLLVGDIFQSCVATTMEKQNPYKGVKVVDEEAFVRQKLNFTKTKVEVDVTSFVESHRISKDVAEFVSEKLEISISSDGKHSGKIRFIESNEIDSIFENTSQILVYKAVKDMPIKYKTKNMTWKLSKGLTFENTAVILTKTALKALTNYEQMKKSSNGSINLLYVALTRSLSDVYLVSPDAWKEYISK